MDDHFNLNNKIFKTLERDRVKEVWLDFMQQLSGDVWTDYNDHDPGITIMEQLCDSMSKLNKRASIPIQNLLNSQSKKKRDEINNAFFDAVEILPANPVTMDDYRVLIIDRVQYVRNAWIETVRDNLEGIEGLYKILLQIDENARTDEGIRKIKEEVFSLFNDHRNLCEDIESIQILDIEKIEVFADIDIGSEVVAEELLAEILIKLEEHLNPSIQYHTLEELIEKGYSVDEAFDGPPPVHGIILKSDLRGMTSEVYVSKLIEIVQGIEGVRRISYFKVEKNGIPVDGDVIPIKQNTYPVLNMDTIDDRFTESADYPMQFYRGALNYEIDLNTANQLLYSMYAHYKKGYRMKMLYHEKDFPSTITLDEVSTYNSIQNALPLTYGVNELGLPDYVKSTRERLAMVKQLRGYLLFFEQIICNYLAQLSNVRNLFSTNKDIEQTYYSQVPDELPGIIDIMNANTLEAFKEKVDKVTREFDPFVERRNRFLDHLLSRFGEQFSTDFLLKVSNYVGLGSNESLHPDMELINAKIEFLNNYIDISKNRGKGFNYLAHSLESWNVSGIEKRATLLLNIKDSGNASLSVGYDQKAIDDFEKLENFLTYVPKDTIEGRINLEKVSDIESDFGLDLDNLDEGLKDELDRLRESLGQQDEDSDENGAKNEVKVEETIDYSKQFVFRADSQKELISNLMSHGILSHNYIILPSKNKKTFSIYYKGLKKLGVFKVREVNTKLACKVEIEKLITYLNEFNKLSEGMHVIEHILLRPQAKDQYGFVLVDDQDVLLLESYEFGEIDQQRTYAQEIINVGTLADNFSIRTDENNKYVVTLMDNYDQLIAKHPQSFDNSEDAQEKILDVIDFIRSFKNSDVSIFDNIKFRNKERSGLKTIKDYYSLSMSVILPKWPTRFQNSDFKDLIKNIIVLNAPVYIHIDFVWLDADEMVVFEDIYFDWLQERIKIEPLQPDLDEKAQKVLLYLVEKIESSK